MFLQFLTELKNRFKNITPSVPPHGKLTPKKVSAEHKVNFSFKLFYMCARVILYATYTLTEYTGWGCVYSQYQQQQCFIKSIYKR